MQNFSFLLEDLAPKKGFLSLQNEFVVAGRKEKFRRAGRRNRREKNVKV
jgi:hypothetical protein